MDLMPTPTMPTFAKTQLVRLPPEIRVMIYKWVIHSQPKDSIIYSVFPDSYAEYLERCTRETSDPVHEVKSYSFMFSCMEIFHEAEALVLETHPLVLTSRDGFVKFPSRATVIKPRHLVLDVEASGLSTGNMIRRAVHAMGKLEQLEHIDILLPLAFRKQQNNQDSEAELYDLLLSPDSRCPTPHHHHHHHLHDRAVCDASYAPVCPTHTFLRLQSLSFLLPEWLKIRLPTQGIEQFRVDMMLTENKQMDIWHNAVAVLEMLDLVPRLNLASRIAVEARNEWRESGVCTCER